MNNTTTERPLGTPNILAFNRKLEVSDALMTSGLWSNIDNDDGWNEIKLHDKRNRATFSQKGAKDVDKVKPNLAWGDDATLPHDTDTLRLKFSLKVMGQLNNVAACNKPEFEKALTEAIRHYQINYNFSELALRYANNIANCRFLWRNRAGAEDLLVKIKYGEINWNFNGYDYPLHDFVQAEKGSDLTKLANVIQKGLQGESFEYIEVTAFAKLGFGQHVWPSQEMVLNIPKGEKGRILYKLNGCAAMHSEKIGNALRTIDTWYTEDEGVRAIAVEPYGSVTTKGEAHRRSKNDFYTLLTKWLSDHDSVEQKEMHYIVATLIRGGVFGGKNE